MEQGLEEVEGRNQGHRTQGFFPNKEARGDALLYRELCQDLQHERM